MLQRIARAMWGFQEPTAIHVCHVKKANIKTFRDCHHAQCVLRIEAVLRQGAQKLVVKSVVNALLDTSRHTTRRTHVHSVLLTAIRLQA